MGTTRCTTSRLITAAYLAALMVACSRAPEPADGRGAVSVIVQANDQETARAAVLGVGGVITHELGIIRAIGRPSHPRRRSDWRPWKASESTRTARSR